MSPIAYLRRLPKSRAILWCYLIWYLTMAGFYFDPAIRIWTTSLGISLVIGVALILSVATAKAEAKVDYWQRFRLFLMPFCVSSFSSLVKDRGFVLIFSPHGRENALALGLCLAFTSLVWLLQRRRPGLT
jgi:hypothetical protein